MRKILLLSTSTVHGTPYMNYAAPYMRQFLGKIDSILFVPYARPSGISHERYTELFRDHMQGHGYTVAGIHETADPIDALHTAAALFVGGGNTFVLLRALHEQRLIAPMRKRVEDGLPYMGSSAGSNIAGLSLGTTNDMPIVFPPSFDALGLVPFNINPHYIDPDPASTHMGETRQTRIKEFHVFNPQPVIGLREGALLEINGNSMRLQGTTGGRLFRPGSEPEELGAGAQLDYLLAKSP
ncbi:MAG TPA: dipeptidase PepE [Acidobacteriota bacterium]|nr:dipeptidase PepE [Acidobacteriota bacterium]